MNQISQSFPKLGEPLAKDILDFLHAFAKSCRKTVIEMLKNSLSGHPGGSLSSMDYLTLIYTLIVSQTGEDVVVSHGHISPAVYSVLSELGYIPKDEVIRSFRKAGSPYEGHITRHVPGILYGTGPLGIGGSVGTGFAIAEKLKKIFVLAGDGECQEGQVYEMMHFARKYSLSNLILFIDENKVQLTDSISNIMPIDLSKTFQAADWNVKKVDGHDFNSMWKAIAEAYQEKEKPTVLIGHTIMGKGVDFMEAEGEKQSAMWHGNAPKPEQADIALKNLELTETEKKLIENFHTSIKWHPEKPNFTPSLSQIPLDCGNPILYTAEVMTDCRTAYGKALLDLAKKNKNIIAVSADLRGSVMTKYVAEELPDQHIECGIAEQHMVSCAGGLSLKGMIPFASTFGAFMTSRAKDQARVNDINDTNVKMVATHCGLSVGEDGPTHQAIDDAGSFLGFFNTMVIEPADPNHTDRIIRYIAGHYGNFYVRMGRHKLPIITQKDGTPFYDEKYQYEYGKTDCLHDGADITIAACGSMVTVALQARSAILKENPSASIAVIAVSSMKKFDETLMNSIRKTKKVITVEDHNPYSGLGGSLAKELLEKKIEVQCYKTLGVTRYQFSGKPEELYSSAGISWEHIRDVIKNI
ncbi:transketolase [Candidatus Peregrinibacteria bacterium]|nr:transketolase [Candidatus Peregrinibacteria bacterium]